MPERFATPSEQTARRDDPMVTAVAALGIGFQLLHAAEHLTQAAYWFSHPGEPPWMSPLGQWVHHRTMTFGLTTQQAAEAMHLGGNALFLVGLSCLWRNVCDRCAGLGASRVSLLRKAWILEAAHCLEHVALTVSALVTGRAVGLSTGVGLLEAGPVLWSYRVWWHLVANLAPLVLIGAALLRPAAIAAVPSTCRHAPHGRARALGR